MIGKSLKANKVQTDPMLPFVSASLKRTCLKGELPIRRLPGICSLAHFLSPFICSQFFALHQNTI